MLHRQENYLNRENGISSCLTDGARLRWLLIVIAMVIACTSATAQYVGPSVIALRFRPYTQEGKPISEKEKVRLEHPEPISADDVGMTFDFLVYLSDTLLHLPGFPATFRVEQNGETMRIRTANDIDSALFLPGTFVVPSGYSDLFTITSGDLSNPVRLLDQSLERFRVSSIDSFPNLSEAIVMTELTREIPYRPRMIRIDQNQVVPSLPAGTYTFRKESFPPIPPAVGERPTDLLLLPHTRTLIPQDQQQESNRREPGRSFLSWSIVFCNDSTGWRTALTDTHPVIEQTTDGGRSWHRDFRKEELDILFADFVDERTGFFVSLSRAGSDEGSMAMRLYRTTDGGETLEDVFDQHIYIPYFPYNRTQEFFAISPHTLLLLLHGETLMIRERGNGGWESITMPQRVFDVERLSPRRSWVLSSGYYKRADLYIPNHTLRYTGDGGATWRDVLHGGDFYDIASWGDSTIALFGSGYLLLSRDGGNHWAYSGLRLGEMKFYEDDSFYLYLLTPEINRERRRHAFFIDADHIMMMDYRTTYPIDISNVGKEKRE